MKIQRPIDIAKRGWLKLRCLFGEDAYERYLSHWREHHRDEGEPLTRAAFFKAELARKWNGTRRCC
jgi:uncharacterized short protein YbdD (DUF466 family)